MTSSSSKPFPTFRTEGGLLPADLLARVAASQGGLGGLSPRSYHLAGERLSEATQRAWSRALAAWKAFSAGAQGRSEDDPATGLTRERWLLPLFAALDYGRLPPAKGLEVEGKPYPISHLWERTPIHLVGVGVPLDRRSKGVAGAARSSPHGLVQEYLNRSDEHLWGLVSNGLKLRLLRDNVSLTRQAFVEIDLEALMEGQVYSDFVLLWLLCHQSRVEGDPPESCWLERWSQAAREQGTRALEGLRAGVERAIETLGQGFLAHPANEGLRQALRSGDLSPQDYYRQLLRQVFRLLFLFVAEDRDLLHPPEASEAARERYRRYYSTARLRRLAQRRRGTPHPDLWRTLALVVGRLHREGCPELALPALGSFLWSPEAAAHLAGCDLANLDLLEAVRALAFTVEDGGRRAVDYRHLGPEELGSVYEALLELHPEVHLEAAGFRLGSAAGHERKTTGSYYTPAGLIASLLDTALEPVLEEAARQADPEAAILALKVCDPACGSGHFLLAAAHRLAHRLAAVRSDEEEPPPEAVREALRDVIGRCLYGVDLNPMAVELCKVNLWLDALTPGKALSFLDHHLQCGNSLLGATPRLLEEGLPDEAFAPLEGDDKAFCRELRKRNGDERQGQQQLFDHAGQPWDRLGDLATELARLEALKDQTVEDVHAKEEAWSRLVHSQGYEFGRLWADAWCAAFVARKVPGEDRPQPLTEDVFRRLERNPYGVSGELRDEVKGLAEEYGFFHWHLAFPEVFRLPGPGEEAENEAAGWSGGFDVVLGNPPWDRLKLQEKEFFASRHPGIAQASKTSIRRRAIAKLSTEDPELWEEFQAAKRRSEGASHLVRRSGRFPLCGRGDVNTYSVFAELNRTLVSSRGRVGCIVPTGIATDDTTKLFFRDLMERGSLVSLFDFQSGPGLFSEVGHARFKFCLLTLLGMAGEGSANADFAFFLRDLKHLKENERRFTLSAGDIALLNPNTHTCPVFRTHRDAEITKAIYRRVPVLLQEGPIETNPWGVGFLRMLDMSNDSGLFRTQEELAGQGWQESGNHFLQGEKELFPLYEAKMIHHYHHRFGDYRDRKEGSESTSLPEVPAERLTDPKYQPTPRYWVPAEEVEARLEGRWDRGWLLGWRDICRSTDERTVISSVVPAVGVGDKFLLMLSALEPSLACCLLAGLDSMALDYAARQKVGGTSLKYFTMKQLPLTPPAVFQDSCPWARETDLAAWLLPRVLELTYTAWDLEAFARDCGWEGPPFRWDEERRFWLRAEIDAAFFHLYGLSRDDTDYVMETFPIVKKKDMKAHGAYRTKLAILELYDRMSQAREGAEPYTSPLDPAPAAPELAHPPRSSDRA